MVLVLDLVEAIARQAFYCEIEGLHHPYSERGHAVGPLGGAFGWWTARAGLGENSRWAGYLR